MMCILQHMKCTSLNITCRVYHMIGRVTHEMYMHTATHEMYMHTATHEMYTHTATHQMYTHTATTKCMSLQIT